jgi:hypothetical protein
LFTATSTCHGVGLGGGLVVAEVEGESGSEAVSGVDGELGPDGVVDGDAEVDVGVVDGDAFEVLGVFGGVACWLDVVAGRRDCVVATAVDEAG